MRALRRKLKQVSPINKSQNNTHRNDLAVEALEPRLLLSSDPIYLYADPDGITAWFNTSIAQPELYYLHHTIAGIRESFAGGDLFSSAREQAEMQATLPYLDYLLNNLSYYQIKEWNNATQNIPYYIYNSTYIDEYFQKAVGDPICSWFNENYMTKTIQTSLSDKLESWQAYAESVLPNTLPDLCVNTIIAPESAQEGASISVSATISNNSDCGTDSFWCQYFLWPSGGQSDPIFLDNPFAINGLAGGQTTTDSRLVSLPIGELGSNYIGIIINPSTVVPENDTTNNYAITSEPLMIDPLPDFQVVDVWGTVVGSEENITTVRNCDMVQFHVMVGRTQLLAMPEAAISIYASKNPSLDQSAVLLNKMESKQLFADPKQEFAIWDSTAKPLIEVTPGTYFLIAFVDSDNVLSEPYENNNIFVSAGSFVVLNEIIPPSNPGIPDLMTDGGMSTTDNITKDNTPMFKWESSIDNTGGSGVSTYQWRVDGQNWSIWQTNLSATTGVLSDGSHTFFVRAQDNVGNIGPETSLDFVIDTTKPVILNAGPLGKLLDKFDYVDITFSEPMNTNTFSAYISGPQGVYQNTITQYFSNNTYRISFPEQTKGGDYTLVIDSQISDLAGNAMGHSFAGSFSLPVKVLVGINAVPKVSFYDSDHSLVTIQVKSGLVDVTLDGINLKPVYDTKGTTVTGDNITISKIAIIGGTESTQLTIKAKGGDNQAALGAITGSSLGKLNAKGINLTGDIDLSGCLGSIEAENIGEGVTIRTAKETTKGFTLKTNHIFDGVIFDITGKIGKFQTNSFDSGSILADSIGQVKVASGNFDVDINAKTGDILNINTSGNISGNISAEGLIKTITAKYGSITGAVRAGMDIGTVKSLQLDSAILSAGNNIKQVKINGDITDSFILAGYDVENDCGFDALDVLGSGNVGSVSAKGIFSRSYISAGVLPLAEEIQMVLPDMALPYTIDNITGNIGKVSLGSLDSGATTDYGLFATTSIKPVKFGKITTTDTIGYFCVKTL